MKQALIALLIFAFVPRVALAVEAPGPGQPTVVEGGDEAPGQR